MFKEFKEFAMKGNLVDIAVGFVMGAAFGKVVSTFTGGIVAPLIGYIFGIPSMDDLKIVLTPEQLDAAGAVVSPEVALMHGTFLTALIDFIIVAFVMFMMVRGINSMKKKEAAAPAAPPAPTKEEVLLGEIRDLLKK